MIQAGSIRAELGGPLSIQPGQGIPAGGSTTLLSIHGATVTYAIHSTKYSTGIKGAGDQEECE